MKIYLLVISLFLFSCQRMNPDAETDMIIEKHKIEMQRNQDSLDREVANINFATQMTAEKVKQGMKVDDALKYQKRLIDSLNNYTK